MIDHEMQRENEVLQFLLGNMEAIPTEDSCSVTSTCSSFSSVTAEGLDRSSQNDKISQLPTEMDLWDMPEMEPICDTDNEEECAKKVANPAPNVTDTVPSLKTTLDSIPSTSSCDQHFRHSSIKVDKAETCKQRKAITPKISQVQSYFRNLQPRPSQSIKDKQDPKVTITDLLLLLTVTLILIGYCLAIFYRFIYPIYVPLPDARVLYTPWNVSNVSLRILSPTTASPCIRRGQPLDVEWEMANFPSQALREYGSEAFQYRVLLNNDTLLSEVGFWFQQEALESKEQLLKKTMKHRFRKREVDAAASPLAGQGEDLRVQVSFTVPGSDGEIQTLEQRVTCRARSALTIQRVRVGLLEVLRPLDGAIVAKNEPLLVEYSVVTDTSHIQRVQIVIDNRWITKVRDMKEGNILLRGLSEGMHTVEVQALDSNENAVVARALRITVITP